MEDIADADGMHVENVCKDLTHKKNRFKTFKTFVQHVGEYPDLYFKSNTLLQADFFKNFRKLCLKIYHLDPAKYFSTPGLACQATLKNRGKIKTIN